MPFAGREPALLGYDAGVEGPRSVMLHLMRRESPDEGWLSAHPVECSVERLGNGVVDVPAGILARLKEHFDVEWTYDPGRDPANPA